MFEIIADKVNSGKRITYDEALWLYQFAELIDLGKLAQTVRYRLNPDKVVTYLVDRNINYTNVCNTDCSFCAFYRPKSSHPEAYVNSKEVIGEKIQEALDRGATRILLQGGHNDDLPYQYYLDLVQWISSTYPIEINAFSPSEIQQMAKISGKMPREILSELQQVGLKGLPGGGAEILDDDVRRRVSPKKIRSADWISIMEDAHSLGLTTTCTMVIGFGETVEQRLNHMSIVRDAQERSVTKGFSGFNAFISWPLQHNENTSMGRSRHRDSFGAGVPEYLRNLAIGRIFLDNIQHHQSSWPTMGPEVAQIGLHFGCDDIGSTMMEENVVSQAGAPSEYRCSMTAEELRDYIIGAGYRAAQRNSAFEVIERF